MSRGLGRATPPPKAARSALREADERFERERLALYHAYVAALVRRASPLVVDLARHWGLHLAPAFASLAPPWRWPLGRPDPLARHHLRVWSGEVPRASRWRLPDRSVRSADLVAPGGEGLLRLDVRGGCVDACAWIGETLVIARAGRLLVWLPFALPETLATAAPGRLLADVVDHPAFRGRRYRVSRAFADLGGRAVLEARARAVAFSLPVPPSSGDVAVPPPAVARRR